MGPGGNHNVDKSLSVAVAKGYVHSLNKNNQAKCNFDIVQISELNQESDGVMSYMYPFILECDDVE